MNINDSILTFKQYKMDVKASFFNLIPLSQALRVFKVIYQYLSAFANYKTKMDSYGCRVYKV